MRGSAARSAADAVPARREFAPADAGLSGTYYARSNSRGLCRAQTSPGHNAGQACISGKFPLARKASAADLAAETLLRQNLARQETGMAARRLSGYLHTKQVCGMIPSLTVRKRKNRCIPHVYWGIAIFVVVSKYSNLFLPFTFFLNISHLTFCYELIICSETADVMKIIRNSFSFV